MEHQHKEARYYVTPGGKIPYREWFAALRDVQGRAAIRDRIRRLELGNPGNYRSVGSGVKELKIDYGPGYRVYYGEYSGTLVLLLCGGDKSTQHRDITRAHQYWEDYRRR